MDSPTSGALADSPAAPDYATYEREQNERDLGRATPSARPTAPAPSTPDPDPGDVTPDQASADPPPAIPDHQKPKPKNLQTRREQIQSEVEALQEQIRLKKALRAELDSLGVPTATVKPESAPAQQAPKSWERYKSLPGAPKPEQFDVYEDFLDARADFIVEQRLNEREQQSARDRESHERVTSTVKTIEGFRERVAKAREADPAFDSQIDPRLTEVVPAFALRADEPVTAANALMALIVESEAAPDLLRHFSTEQGQADWRELAAQSPMALTRRFGRLEARFLDGGSSAAVPAAKPVTKAPPPPTTLGTQPPASPDRAAAAVAKRDYSSYEAAQNAADLARMRRRA